MRDTNPAESMDAEGLPDLEGKPPGIDVELEQEGEMVPRDHPVAAGADPAYATTQAEERLHESVADRAARENPDFGQEDDPNGFRGTSAVPGDAVTGEAIDEDGETALPADSDVALSAEEAAVTVRNEDDI